MAEIDQSRWESFLGPADEWLLAYAALPIVLTSVHLFAIGHSVELYLKAAVAKRSGKYMTAIKRRHDIGLLLQDCATVLPEYQLQPNVLAQSPLSAEAYDALPESDREHYDQHAPLYIVAARLADWKYWGAPRKEPGPMAFAFVYPDDYWIGFFRTIRGFLEWPRPNKLDRIARALEGSELGPAGRAFLAQLYEK